MILFCFSYAGGSASFWKQYSKEFSKETKIVLLEYPGHGTRMKEQLCNDFRTLIVDLYSYIKRYYTGEAYSLLGYSMGSIAVIEMCRYIIELDELQLPVHIFLAAHAPRSIVDTYVFERENSDELLKQRTIEFGGVPEKLIKNSLFWRTYLPIFKSDYWMISRYQFDDIYFSQHLHVTVFYSEEDTPTTDIKRWQDCFVNKVEFVRFEGSHFFIKIHYAEMIRIIEERLNNEL